MRMLAFLVLVLAGALAGWAIGQDEALATRLVLAAVGALVGLQWAVRCSRLGGGRCLDRSQAIPFQVPA